ncbi:hypothetical protein RU639_013550 [Aspergillus parasiticus]
MASPYRLIESVSKRLNVLEDKDKLWSLVNEYYHAVDSGDLDSFAAICTGDDTNVRSKFSEVAHQKYIWNCTSETCNQKFDYCVCNAEFNICDSNTANGSVLLFYTRTKPTSKPATYYAIGRCKFDFKKINGAWKVAEYNLEEDGD